MRKSYVDEKGLLIEDKNMKNSDILCRYTPKGPMKLQS